MRFVFWLLISVLHISAFAQQDVGFDLFYCENTLNPSYIQTVDTEAVLLEIPLNASAVISKIALFYVLKPDVSLLNISDIPVNFSSIQSYTFKLKKGAIERDVIMRTRQIKTRSGAFNVNFINNYKPADWSLFTTGWMVVGIDQDATDVFLNHDNAAFFMAGDENQNFLTFDLVDNGQVFDGVLVVEGSLTGINNWDPIYVLDNCNAMPVENLQTVRLKLPKSTRYIRISFQKNQPSSSGVSLNNFQLKLYDGGDYDNKTNVSSIADNQDVQIQSSMVQNEIQLLNIDWSLGRKYAIYSMDGRICQTGELNSSTISVESFNQGIYLLKINELPQAIKFIKK